MSGGAELHVETLRAQLVARGCEVDVVALPFAWEPHGQVLKSALAWRLLQLQEEPRRPIDLVIATKFPSYLIRHPNKILWLIHQFRQVYELLGTPYSDYTDSPADQDIVRMVREMDTRALAECRALFTNAGNTAHRLQRFNGLAARPLYPPPPLEGRYHEGAFGDYVFTATRLDAMKRVDLLLRALAYTRAPVRAKIAGRGPECAALEALVAELGLGDRVELLGWVDDEQLVDLYAGSLAVYYAPFDEDYGYVTVEGFRSGKPVLTTCDARRGAGVCGGWRQRVRVGAGRPPPNGGAPRPAVRGPESRAAARRGGESSRRVDLLGERHSIADRRARAG